MWLVTVQVVSANIKDFAEPINYCKALSQQMRFREGVYYNPSPLCSLLCSLLCSALARKRFIFSSLITWQQGADKGCRELNARVQDLSNSLTTMQTQQRQLNLQFVFLLQLTWLNHLTLPQRSYI